MFWGQGRGRAACDELPAANTQASQPPSEPLYRAHRDEGAGEGLLVT